MKIIRSSLLLVVLAFVTYMFFGLYSEYTSRDSLNTVAHYYAKNAPEQTGAANLVTSVVVHYRGLDTLGEVTILFLTAAVIGLLLRSEKSSRRKPLRANSEFLTTASRILIPMIGLVGIYIFMNGHLSPGGGFQGGAVIASGFILLLMATTSNKVGHRLMEWIEAISGFSFILLGVAGLILAGGFIDTTFLSEGTFGALLSAGAIPLIYSLIGLKVGAELSTILLELNHK